MELKKLSPAWSTCIFILILAFVLPEPGDLKASALQPEAGSSICKNEDQAASFDSRALPKVKSENSRILTVTGGADTVNGDVSSVDSVTECPGGDGLSLWEALSAANNDPGKYTILFDSELKDAAIKVGSRMLPGLLSGNVTINGDTDGDNKPDISIEGSGEGPVFRCFRIASGGNILHALSIRNFRVGVILQAYSSSDKTFAGNTVSGLDVQDVEEGILLQSYQCYPDVGETNETWENTSIAGNDIEAAHSGITIRPDFSSFANYCKGIALNQSPIFRPCQIAPGISIGGRNFGDLWSFSLSFYISLKGKSSSLACN